MRKSQEINKAIAILRKKDDRISMIQADVLKERRTEVWVFEHFVRDMAKAEQDEEVYCAARDAAKYLNGKLELEELIPDWEKWNTDTVVSTERLPSPNEMWKMIQELSSKVNRLERIINKGREFNIYTPDPQNEKPEYEESEYMLQAVAYKYIGCSLTTLKSWKKKGIVPFYRKGGRVYYKKSDIDNNPILNRYKSTYK